MADIIDRQQKIKLDRRIFQSFAETALDAIAETENKSLTIVFVSDRKMRSLNREFRGPDKTTDVLSFPFEPDDFETAENNLGDIVISVEQAARQAEESGLPLEQEIKQLILHGVLHLCGYDHEIDSGQMNARELELREVLSI